MVTITEKEFWKLSEFIKSNYGINLKEEKKSLVMGRLYNVLVQRDCKNFSDYYDYVVADKTGAAATKLIEKITTNHTFFMREADHFYYLKSTVLSHTLNTIRDKDLRIWSAGCSTGEEPYTLAMLLDDFLGKEKLLWDSKILATDISDKVLDIAQKGIYDNEKINALPLQWRLSYFKKYDGEKSIVVDRIRDEVIYRKFNLMEEVFPFKRKFHIIFCRNVMIYFDNKTRDELVNKYYRHLEYGGYLFIGHSESLNRGTTRFKYVMPAVYRKE